MRPLALAQVCYAWRTIALQTPRLWTNLRICVHGDLRAPVLNPAAIYEELKKTAQAPLHLTLSMRSDPVSFIEDDRLWVHDNGPEIWNILCAEADRWETIVLNDYPSEAFAMYVGLEFPALRRIGWRTKDIDNPLTEYEIPSPFFVNAPNLDFLHIEYQVPPIRLLPPPSWSLAKLRIISGDQGIEEDKPPIAPCIPFILACSATLRTCHVWSEMFGSFAEDKTPVPFPVLEELHLDWAAIHFCRLISAPNIQVVRLAKLALDDWSQPGDEFAAFE
ncbi:hypothetical protein BD626DRAFT_536705 [Schizophyllum amplum]|uniref:F-box domain-containing protein n=1 Tax=Schizophyllum amplum TaxID=97359 RepID=A0A550CGV0_9AGAR|nr:hypothetical protein BD626DRAFT_536705 [Auriculariopsis ampla]